MIIEVECDICKHISEYTINNLHISHSKSYVVCNVCNNHIIIQNDRTIKKKMEDKQSIESLPVLEEGAVVIVDNKEHPLNNEIGLICERKHKHYRVEIQSNKIWLPEHWVKLHELNEFD